ncbi:hypothetical protein CJF30_00011104 [Rutstroemia sp. NJR-2017a BBW]|nr:hypothetical protein CJF30_00011104 [Rutstroemia sp. NJR-2017a BBW]
MLAGLYVALLVPRFGLSRRCSFQKKRHTLDLRRLGEIRPNFMSMNSLKTDDGKGSIRNEGIMEIIDQELRNTMLEIEGQKGYFGVIMW